MISQHCTLVSIKYPVLFLTTVHVADCYLMLASQLASVLLILADLSCDYIQSVPGKIVAPT